MSLKFYKYQGAGNDFIIIDNRTKVLDNPDNSIISQLCDRRFGIGADGLMLLEDSPGYDFKMIYYNADGFEGSMCGNGGRCIAAFAKKLGIIDKFAHFLAVDGEHKAITDAPDYVELEMGQVSDISLTSTHCFLNTGSPHDIRFVNDADTTDVYTLGRTIRYSETYAIEGVNVNFVEITGRNSLKVYTYERGVEDETLACGTGVTAAALAYFLQKTAKTEGRHDVSIKTKGGDLSVRFQYKNGIFSDIWLCGPATEVFEGTIQL